MSRLAKAANVYYEVAAVSNKAQSLCDDVARLSVHADFTNKSAHAYVDTAYALCSVSQLTQVANRDPDAENRARANVCNCADYAFNLNIRARKFAADDDAVRGRLVACDNDNDAAKASVKDAADYAAARDAHVARDDDVNNTAHALILARTAADCADRAARNAADRAHAADENGEVAKHNFIQAFAALAIAEIENEVEKPTGLPSELANIISLYAG